MTTVPLGAQAIGWISIAPPVIVAIGAIVALLVPKRSAKAITLLTLGISLLALIPLADGKIRETFCLPGGCSYVVDSTTLTFQLIAGGGALVVALLSMPKDNLGEHYFLLLCSVSGAMTMAAARDLITLAVALELVTLPAIALVGLRASGRQAEAALKFFLVSVVSVAVMLFGISLVYGVTGSVQFDVIEQRLSQQEFPAVAGVAIVLTLVGLAFKVAAVPFHFWVPETYSGAPIPIAAYLSVVSKAAGLVGLVLVVSRAFTPYSETWSPVLGVLAAVTMTVGNLVALRQTDSVRLLAWSSIAQAGFILVPLGALSHGTDKVLGATVAYLLIYAVVNLGAFTVVSIVGGGPIERFRGLFWTDRKLALALAFFLLALAGLPPGIAGLFGKVVVVQAAVRGDATWLAIIAAVNVAIGLAYYLRWTAALFTPADQAAGSRNGEQAQHEGTFTPLAGPLTPAPSRLVALALVAALGIALSVAPTLALSVL